MKLLAPLTLLALMGLAVPTAQAQGRFHWGPRVGLTLSSASFERGGRSFQPTPLPGWEAGVQGDLAFGHFALQPALLYTQKGFRVDESVGPSFLASSPEVYDERYRLTYLTLPLNLAYRQRADGTGIHVVAGGYIGRLLGGHYAVDNRYALFPTGSVSQQQRGQVRAQATQTITYGPGYVTDYDFYSQPWDAGLQAGVGYGLGAWLLQLTYSQGLRQLAPEKVVDYGTTVTTIEGPRHQNRGLQASLTYWLYRKS